MNRETNDQKYLREISDYQRKAEKFLWLSIPVAALTVYFIIDTMANGLPEGIGDRAIGFAKIATSFFVWHEVFGVAEGQVSKMKQAIRDYCHDKEELRSPVMYTWTTKVIQKLMPLYDNSPLPPDAKNNNNRI